MILPRSATDTQALLLRDLRDHQGSKVQNVAARVRGSIAPDSVRLTRKALKRMEGKWTEQDRLGHWYITLAGRSALQAYELDQLLIEDAL